MTCSDSRNHILKLLCEPSRLQIGLQIEIEIEIAPEIQIEITVVLRLVWSGSQQSV